MTGLAPASPVLFFVFILLVLSHLMAPWPTGAWCRNLMLNQAPILLRQQVHEQSDSPQMI